MKRLLNPAPTDGGSNTVTTTPEAPIKSAKISNPNPFLHVVAADGTELYLEVEAGFQRAIQPIVQQMVGAVAQAQQSAQMAAQQEAKAVVGKLAQAEQKHPYTTLIIIGAAIVAFVVLLVIAIRY